MRPTKAIATCAVTTMAMVFSVQQGQHGPLVTYKLEVPRTVEAVNPPRVTVPLSAVTRDMDAAPSSEIVLPEDVAPLQAIAPAAPKMSPLQPTILGTVVMPADRAAAVAARRAPQIQPQPTAVPLTVPDSNAVYQIVSDYEGDGEIMVNERTGERITLQAVNDEVRWRRDTAQRLRNHPFAPRF